MWVWVSLQSLNIQISPLFRAKSSLTFRQLQSVESLWNTYGTWQEHTALRKNCVFYRKAKKLALEPLCLLFFSNNFRKRGITSNKMPAVKIMTGRWVWGYSQRKCTLILTEAFTKSMIMYIWVIGTLSQLCITGSILIWNQLNFQKNEVVILPIQFGFCQGNFEWKYCAFIRISWN